MSNRNLIKRKILELSYTTKCGHLGSILSIVDILNVLYGKIIDYKKDDFILSKGHAGLALYVVLWVYGLLKYQQLETYYKDGSLLHGHVSHYATGVIFSTGSLGHGSSVACGLALGQKIKKTNNKVFSLIGDGQCNQGSIWEMSMFASSYKLNNLTVIIDKNNLQAIGTLIDKENLSNKWKAFGWEVIEINGHNQQNLVKAFEVQSDKPKCIIAYTVKGNGISFMENNNDWHYNKLTKQQYQMAIQELK